MNDDLHDHGLGDLAAQLDAAASTVHADADVADVRRRLSRQRRLRASAGTAVVAVALVASVAVWQSGDQPVTVASGGSSTTQPASGSSASADGGGDATTRTTSEGLLVSLSSSQAGFPGTPWWTPPESCRGPLQHMVSVVDPSRGGNATSAVSFMPAGGEEAVTVDSTLLYVGKPIELEDMALSGIPATTGPTATTVPPDHGIPIIGATVVAGGTSFGGEGADPSMEVPEPDAWAIAVSVAGDEVRHATVTFANGTVDEADAVDGTIGLAGRFPAGPSGLTAGLITKAEVTLEHGDPIVVTDLGNADAGFDELGTRLDSSGDVTATTITTITTEPVAPECTPPPAPLPGPGEQPADASAATVAVTAAVESFMDGSRSEADREASMSDPDHGRRISEELGAGYAAVMTSARSTVTDVVFVSPATAIVRYDLDLTPTGTEPLPIPKDMFHDSVAKVVLVDGRWVVTPESLCRITSVATPNACAGMPSAYPEEVFGPGGSAS